MLTSFRARMATTPPGYQLSLGRIFTIYAALMLTLLLASLDQTIVATALPAIVSDIGGLSNYSWVVTAYILATTITIPIYGKLGDIYGRRWLIVGAIFIFIMGSALCGAATSMSELVAFRAVQGVGAGGLVSLALAIVASIIPPRDRGKYTGLLGSVFAFGALVGPLVGGFLVDNAGWRWAFYVNVPIGGAATVVILATIPKRAVRKERSIDYRGAALLMAGTTAVLLGLVWAGEYPWSSWHVAGTLGVGVALLVAFAFAERGVKEPILPFGALRKRLVSAGVLLMAFHGMCAFGTITFVPLFVQGVIGTSATASGVVLTPFLIAAVTTSALAGQVISRTGRYRPNALVGPIVLGIGLTLIWRMDTGTTNAEAARNMAIAGVGIGLMDQAFILAVQNSVKTHALGAVTALTQFSRAIGQTLGVTIMGLILSLGLSNEGRQRAALHRLPPHERTELVHALRPAFLFTACVAGLALLVAFAFLEQVPLRKSVEDAPVEPAGTPIG